MIEPSKCIVEDWEVLGFESEEQLDFYTIWHEALVDKRRELNAESERERQIIRNEIVRKTRQLIGPVAVKATTSSSNVKSSAPPKSPIRSVPTIPSSSPRRTATTSALAASRKAIAAAVAFRPSRTNQAVAAQSAISHQRQGSATLPNGLMILNSTHYNTLQNNKVLMKYKLTKLYNKYRGRQLRRNFVNDKQKNARIEVEIGKSYLNSWLAYTALQALRLPDNNTTSLNATTNNNSTILTPMAQPMVVPKKVKTTPSKSGKQQIKSKQPQGPQKPPMHLVYIDPGNLITYSNKINPQQVADYRRKSHLLPSSATSKKSSAASYDVYEIMEVLANTNKTNVTITRNANRQTQSGATTSIYSHSVNSNTPGIVSTQLHLQARSYLDLMSKFYAEEVQRLEKAREDMKLEISDEEVISKYLKIDYPIKSQTSGSSGSLNSSGDRESDNEMDNDEFELEQLEEDIHQMSKNPIVEKVMRKASKPTGYEYWDQD